MAARMAGYDSAELRQPVGDPDRERKKALALAARDRLRELVLDQVVHVRCGDFDKYGRPLVTLWTLGDPPLDVNALMLAERHGLPYAGKRKPGH
jgi:endonuclease YncB( thermonuclease family)